MMGAGKSSVGRALARRLGRAFLDTDEEIERGAGLRVREIFAREGEAGFRAREREEVAAAAGSGAVVALGGGAVGQPEVLERVLASGTLVYLRARPETLLARVGSARERPLLAPLGPEARLLRLRELLAEREPAYLRAAHCVDTDGLDPEEVAVRVAALLCGGAAQEAAGGR
jgi:shikimate kinase